MSESLQVLRSHARQIWHAGVEAANAGRLVEDAVGVRGAWIRFGDLHMRLAEIDSILVVGGGKAGAEMSAGFERSLGERIPRRLPVRGWVHVPDRSVRRLKTIHLHGARSRPDNRPTASGVEGTRRLGEMLDGATRRDLVVCLLSGGASALLPAPVPGVSLAAKRRVTTLLHRSGASIEEMNAVRKHLSWLKGGGMVRRVKGGRIVSLIISDVIGDRLDVIGSGPTAPDPTTFADAVEVLRRHRIWSISPLPVRRVLQAGVAGARQETLKRLPARVHNVVIGNNRTALEAAAREARRLGYRVVRMPTSVAGEAGQAGAQLARMASRVRDRGDPVRPPACILSGGETTVRLGRTTGKGGRNQELVLAALCWLQEDGLQGIVLLSAGTDGEDGPTDAAGACGDRNLWRRAASRGMDPGALLARHDSYNFFSPLDGLLKTGPTGTNVMDLQVVLVGAPG